MPSQNNLPGYLARTVYFTSQRLNGAQGSIAAQRQQALKRFRHSLKAQRIQRSLGSTAPHQQASLRAQPGAPLSAGVLGERNWYPLGPAVILKGQAATYPAVSGRVTGIAVSADGRTLYVGSANGGVWRSTDGGHNWYATMNAFNLMPHTAQSDSLAVGAIAIDPDHPERVFAGSGEAGNVYFNYDAASASGSGYWGVGPISSEDGGNSWSVESRKNSSGKVSFDWSDVAFYKLAIDPLKPSRLLAATTAGIFVRQPRNLQSFMTPNGPAEYIPQSYLFILDPDTGTLNLGYWRKNLTGFENGQFGASPQFTEFDQLVTLYIDAVPYIFMYVSKSRGPKTAGSYLLCSIDGDATPKLATHSSGTWQPDLNLMALYLNSEPHLLRYNPSNGEASLALVDASGSMTTVQSALKLKPGLQLCAFLLEGQAYSFAYASHDGSATIYRWEPDGSLIIMAQQLAGTWPVNAQVHGFTLSGSPYVIVYAPSSGAYSVNRINNDLVPLTMYSVPADDAKVFNKHLKLLGFTDNDKSYLLTTSAETDVLNLYSLTPCTGEPKPLWSTSFAGSSLATPFLMGYEWSLMLPPSKVEGNAATDIVSSSDGLNNAFFAAFEDGPVYSSQDKGMTWIQTGTDNPFSGRVSLGVQASNAKTLYGLDQTGSLYMLASPYSSHSWRLVTNTPSPEDLLGVTGPNTGQGGYDLVLGVSPSDDTRIYLGGSAYHATVGTSSEWSGSFWRCKINLTQAKCTHNIMIGASLHADLHALVFDPANPGAAWVGCDGGMFYTPDIAGSNIRLFEPRNAGLNTMTQERLAAHPDYDAVLFGCSQDNGCQRFMGDEAWLSVFKGDSGAAVVDWSNTAQVICSYTHNQLSRSTQYGNDTTFTPFDVPLSAGDDALFYAPLIGTPKHTGVAGRLAFGSMAAWISDTFGTAWQSLPNNDASDLLNAQIRALAFSADGKTLFVATLEGEVWVYIQGTPWTRTQVDATGQNKGLPVSAPITGIAVDPKDNASLWICYGGGNPALGIHRVWYYEASSGSWSSRSGAGDQSLLEVQYNCIASGPASDELWAGADIGIWHSMDGGQTWRTESDGLPEAAVLDLTLFPANAAIAQPALLRATTYGRGTYERILSNDPSYQRPVQLYIRRTPLDRGLYPAINGLVIPDDSNQTTDHRNSPDLKLIQAQNNNFTPAGALSFQTFSELDDQSASMAVQTLSRVFVQVHNRGIQDAINTRVRLLISSPIGTSANVPPTQSNPSPAPKPPALPQNLREYLGKGNPVPPPRPGQSGWFDLGTQVIRELIAGVPKVISADIALAQLASVGVYCLLAITYQDQDLFISSETDADSLTLAEAKVAMKYLTVT